MPLLKDAATIPPMCGRYASFLPAEAMARTVTYAHRYKRPPRRKKAVALEGPKVVRRRASEVAPPANVTSVTPASEARKSGIVTYAYC